jgi:hypothetical protein
MELCVRLLIEASDLPSLRDEAAVDPGAAWACRMPRVRDALMVGSSCYQSAGIPRFKPLTLPGAHRAHVWDRRGEERP